jgi:hypothetical protein
VCVAMLGQATDGLESVMTPRHAIDEKQSRMNNRDIIPIDPDGNPLLGLERYILM